MKMLEDLWYGNIRAVEEFLVGSKEYKNLLRILASDQERLKDTLPSKQVELFEKYDSAIKEMSTVSESTEFKYSFCLAVKLFNETTE